MMNMNGTMYNGYGYMGPMGPGYGNGYNQYAVSSGFDFNSLLFGLLNLSINILSLLLVVGLIAAGVVIIKRYLSDGSINLGGLLTTNPKTVCNCGQTFDANWTYCPKCGQQKPSATQQRL